MDNGQTLDAAMVFSTGVKAGDPLPLSSGICHHLFLTCNTLNLFHMIAHFVIY
jgi:hypothetical protein